MWYMTQELQCLGVLLDSPLAVDFLARMNRSVKESNQNFPALVSAAMDQVEQSILQYPQLLMGLVVLLGFLLWMLNFLQGGLVSGILVSSFWIPLLPLLLGSNRPQSGPG